MTYYEEIIVIFCNIFAFVITELLFNLGDQEKVTAELHKDVNELIDLDSHIQLHDRANNELLIIPENTATTSEPSSDEDEDDSTNHSAYVFLNLFLLIDYLKKWILLCNLLLRPC